MKALKNYSNVWTHEIGHNQSYKFFFQGNGFREIGGNKNENLGTEDYTDGHTTQTFGDGDVNWNLSYDYTPDSLITTNLTPDRINSVEKIGKELDINVIKGEEYKYEGENVSSTKIRTLCNECNIE